MGRPKATRHLADFMPKANRGGEEWVNLSTPCPPYQCKEVLGQERRSSEPDRSVKRHWRRVAVGADVGGQLVSR